MKKAISVMLTFVILSLPMFTSLSAQETDSNVNSFSVLEARFLNMLNHSDVYGNDFDSVEDIVHCSVTALVKCDVNKGKEYISENIVNSYLYNMYGFTIDDFSQINKAFPQREGYIYVLPRGYELYNHTAVNLKLNKDGSFTFITTLEITSHDRTVEKLTCETIFIENTASQLGYNIVNSTF